MKDRRVLVVDATVIVKWYLPEVYSEHCIKLLDSGIPIKTSEIAISQIAASLWKRARTGEIRPEQASRIVANIEKLPIEFAPIAPHAAQAVEISLLSSRTFNEALYFHLALQERTNLITADHRWFSLISTGRLKAYVEFVEDANRRVSHP